MREAIKNLINKWACGHDWEQFLVVDVDGGEYCFYHMHHFKCLNCGKFKRIKSS